MFLTFYSAPSLNLAKTLFPVVFALNSSIYIIPILFKFFPHIVNLCLKERKKNACKWFRLFLNHCRFITPLLLSLKIFLYTSENHKKLIKPWKYRQSLESKESIEIKQSVPIPIFVQKIIKSNWQTSWQIHFLLHQKI